MAATTEKPLARAFLQRHRRSILIDYSLTTSTHGLRSIAAAYNTLHRVFWIVAFVGAFVCMSGFIVFEILQYLSFPTQINVEIVLKRNMPFPAVTFCNANPFRSSHMNKSLSMYAEESGLNVTEERLHTIAFTMLVDRINQNRTSELTSVGFQLSDILLECSYNGMNCSENFVRSLSPIFGNCFTFNWKTATNRLFTLADVGPNMTLFEGLSLSFYYPRHLTFPMPYSEDGLVVQLHENDELPMISRNGLRLQPGLAHKIAYRKSQTIFLHEPYTNCISTIDFDIHELYESTFEPDSVPELAYSEEVCNQLCEQAFIFAQCSCIYPIPFFTRRVLMPADDKLILANCCVPTTSQNACATKARREFVSDSTLRTKWCSRCAPQCEHTQFITELSALDAPTSEQKSTWSKILLRNQSHLALPSDFDEHYDDYMDANFLGVTVTCGSQYMTINKQQAKIGIVDTFSAVGGQSGL